MFKLQMLLYAYLISRKSYKTFKQNLIILKEWLDNPSSDGQWEEEGYYALINSKYGHIPYPMLPKRLKLLYDQRVIQYGYSHRAFSCPVCGEQSYYTYKNSYCKSCNNLFDHNLVPLDYDEYLRIARKYNIMLIDFTKAKI